jgi:hypothetical protein
MTKPLFEERADRTLDKVRAVYAQRGGEYADTWRTCRFLAMKAVSMKLNLEIRDEYLRALATAAFVDMKYERLSGGFKDDSIIDGIAYGAFLVDEMDEACRKDDAWKPVAKQEQQYRMLEVGEGVVPGDEYLTRSGDKEHWGRLGLGLGSPAVREHEKGKLRRPINPQENAVR